MCTSHKTCAQTDNEGLEDRKENHAVLDDAEEIKVAIARCGTDIKRRPD